LTGSLLAGPAHERKLAVKIAAYRLGLKIRGIDVEPAWGYSDSGGPYLEPILRTLDITPADSVVDLGSGKGGALLTMVRYPFARVDGVEISPELAEISRINLARAAITKSEVYCCDAAEFPDLDSYTFIYMFNPFPPSVLERVMENLNASIVRRPRPLTVIYMNPEDHDIVMRAASWTVHSFPDCLPGVCCKIYQR
jgi:SAM-dependent methyltransferase